MPSEQMTEILSEEPTEVPSENTSTESFTESETSSEFSYMYSEGVYYDKNWRELTSEEKTHAPIDFEEAYDRVSALFAERQQKKGFYPDCVLVFVFYDTEDEVWVFGFGKPLMFGGGYSFAISRMGGHILGEWPGE